MKQSIFTCTVLALGLSAPAIAAPVQWTAGNGGNDHWYELISHNLGTLNWTTAKSLAEASTGYLATITSADEQSFVNGINGSNVRAWLGGTDSASEGTWEWATGEAFASYTNWTNWAAANDSNAKDYLAGWAWAASDKWKYCSDNKDDCDVVSYVVEYDAAPVEAIAAVPLPATLPFIAAGLGLLTFVGRRRKKS